MSEEEIYLLPRIKKFQKRFFYGKVINTPRPKPQPDNIMWSFQHLPDKPLPGHDKITVQYWPVRPLRELSYSDLLFHFQRVPRKQPGSFRGSLATVGKFDDNIAMWFCIDADNQLAVDTLRDKFIPVCDDYQLDYIWEQSGTSEEEKCHLWVMCDKVDISLLLLFIQQLFEDAEINPRDRELSYEIYPALKGRNVIRLPGGVHLKTKTINKIEYKGKISNEVGFVLDSFNNSKQLTTEDIKKVLRVKEPTKRKTEGGYKKHTPFYFNSRNLSVEANLPPLISKVGKNCQAINQILKEATNGLLKDRLGLGHDAGLYLWRLAHINDALTKHFPGVRGDEGKRWIESFTEENRLRPYDDHGWAKDEEAIKDSPLRYFPTCKTWEEKFDLCKGCPFKERTGFTTPRQIWQGRPILKSVVGDVRLASPKDIRQDTFVRVRDRIVQCANESIRKDILLASPQGSGKSYIADQIAVELAASGKNVLIAAPTAKLAMQHKEWCEMAGQKAMVIMSHEKLFEYGDQLGIDFDCPKAGDIKYMYDLGMSSYAWKSTHCKRCPFVERCPYPKQYKNVAESDCRIIIIQHAHFACRETLYTILQKKYDVLFVDESFVDSVQKRVKPTQIEMEVLDRFAPEIKWAELLLNWITKGGYPKQENDKSTINPTETELDNVKAKLEELGGKWEIPNYIRYYNINMFYDKTAGFHVFYPIPEIPVRVFTDATPPIEYLKTVLDTEEIEVYGDDEVLDFRLLNKENRLIQLMDCSTSKTALRGLKDEETGEYPYERFIEILEMIMDKAKAEHKGEKILITTYADSKNDPNDKFKSVAVEWLKRNYPDFDIGTEPPAQICVSHMQIGTNAFSDYTVQFLLAGVHLNARQYKEQVYNMRSISNYWNRLKGRPLVGNPYPHNIGDGATVERMEEPVKRILLMGARAKIFSFASQLDNGRWSGFTFHRPADPDFNIINKYNIAKTQQAIRLRFIDDRKRTIYVLGKHFLPSFLVTDVILEDELLGYLRDKDSTYLISSQ